MRCPVFRLEKALYGHVNSGNFWQKYCDASCQKAGFYHLPGGENWPSVYYDPETLLFLIVYVDDLKLSGPTHAQDAAWSRLGKYIKLEKIVKLPRMNRPSWDAPTVIRRALVRWARLFGVWNMIWSVHFVGTWRSMNRLCLRQLAFGRV